MGRNENFFEVIDSRQNMRVPFNATDTCILFGALLTSPRPGSLKENYATN